MKSNRNKHRAIGSSQYQPYRSRPARYPEISKYRAFRRLLGMKNKTSINPRPVSESRFSRISSRLVKIVSAGVTALVTIIVLIVLGSDFFIKETIIIEPFATSSEFGAKVEDGSMLGRTLGQKINVLMLEAKSIRTGQKVDVPTSDKVPDIEMPKGGLSAKGFMRYLQEFRPFQKLRGRFGYNPMRVNGEASLLGNRIKIDVRLTKTVEDESPGIPPRTFEGDIEDADAIYTEIGEFVLANSEPYLSASYLYQTKRKDEAVAQIRICIAQGSSENANLARVLWGLILADQKDYDGAIVKFREVIENKESTGTSALVTAYNNWALVLLNKNDGSEAEAIDKALTAIKLNPQYAQAYNTYGLALLGQKDYPGAEEKFNRALSLDPKLAVVYYNLAMVAIKIKGVREAIPAFRAAIALDPNYVDAYSELGLQLAVGLKPAHVDEAIAVLNKAVELDPENANAYRYRADARTEKENLSPQDRQLAINDYQQAIALFQSQIQKGDHDPRIKRNLAMTYNNLGWLCEDEGKTVIASINYENAVAADPGYDNARVNLGNVYKKLRLYEKASKAYKMVLRGADSQNWEEAIVGEAEIIYEQSLSRPTSERLKSIKEAISVVQEALEISRTSKVLNDALQKYEAILIKLSRPNIPTKR
jgi:tetratricopeptide (TPR) repeat protein